MNKYTVEDIMTMADAYAQSYAINNCSLWSRDYDRLEKALMEVFSENQRISLLLMKARSSMSHAKTFIKTKEKMHPIGLQIWEEELTEISKELGEL